MPTLSSNKTHAWKKNLYSSLSFKWSGRAGEGKVSVTNPKDGAATTYEVPQEGIQLTKNKDGSLTNNTDGTIEYTLS